MQKSIASILCVLSFVAFAAPTVSYQTATNIAKKVIDQTLSDALDDKRDKDDLAVYSVTRTENTDWTWTSENKELEAALNEKRTKIYYDNMMWSVNEDPSPHWSYTPSQGNEDDLSVVMYFAHDNDFSNLIPATATRPRYMDETLGPAKPNQQLAAVATDDAAKPADGSLMKYDAASDRFVKATAGTDYADEAKGTNRQVVRGRVFDETKWEISVAESEYAREADHAREAGLVMWSYVEAKPTTLSGYGITDGATTQDLTNAISTNNPAFVSAVRNTPTENMPEDVPTDWGTYGTVGAAFAALAAFVKWAKAKIVAVIGNDGKPTDQFATDLLGKQVANAKVRYALSTTSSATMADRTVNIYTLSSGTVPMVFPTATTHDGKTYARDFLLKLTYSGGTLQMPQGVTKVGDELSFEAGKTYLIAFTEIESDKFYVRSIDITEAQA